MPAECWGVRIIWQRHVLNECDSWGKCAWKWAKASIVSCLNEKSHLFTYRVIIWNHMIMDLCIALITYRVDLPSFRTQWHEHVLMCGWFFRMLALIEGLCPFDRWKHIFHLLTFSPQFFFFAAIFSLSCCLEEFVDLELKSRDDDVLDVDDFFKDDHC